MQCITNYGHHVLLYIRTSWRWRGWVEGGTILWAAPSATLFWKDINLNLPAHILTGNKVSPKSKSWYGISCAHVLLTQACFSSILLKRQKKYQFFRSLFFLVSAGTASGRILPELRWRWLLPWFCSASRWEWSPPSLLSSCPIFSSNPRRGSTWTWRNSPNVRA